MPRRILIPAAPQGGILRIHRLLAAVSVIHPYKINDPNVVRRGKERSILFSHFRISSLQGGFTVCHMLIPPVAQQESVPARRQLEQEAHMRFLRKFVI
ncbi:MAG: hypothetical protein LBV27_06785 [Oscillospiraceae bacterium]|nr:hypothetical protein [Oscillospiraceae bacterium]